MVTLTESTATPAAFVKAAPRYEEFRRGLEVFLEFRRVFGRIVKVEIRATERSACAFLWCDRWEMIHQLDFDYVSMVTRQADEIVCSPMDCSSGRQAERDEQARAARRSLAGDLFAMATMIMESPK